MELQRIKDFICLMACTMATAALSISSSVVSRPVLRRRVQLANEGGTFMAMRTGDTREVAESWHADPVLHATSFISAPMSRAPSRPSNDTLQRRGTKHRAIPLL